MAIWRSNQASWIARWSGTFSIIEVR